MTADENTAPPKRTLEGVVANFVAGLGARLNSIDAAYKAGDWEELQMLSHKLAGAALFGYPELGQVAHTLEKAVKNQELEELPGLIGAVKGECGKIAQQTSL